MKKYVYRARDKSGNLVTGDVEASNESAAAKLLRDRGYIVVSIRPAMNSLRSFTAMFSNRVSYADLVGFTRQLATMVNAGLPITESFSILRLQAKPSFQPIIQQILADIEGGQSLSSAIKRHPRVFTPSYIALVKAGETGGVLDKVLARLADNLERTQEFQGKVKGALIYPAIIVVGMVGVSIIMIVFVIPKLTALYTQFGAELPLSTRILTSPRTEKLRLPGSLLAKKA
jgi:type IV pilus assembly protein PilC